MDFEKYFDDNLDSIIASMREIMSIDSSYSQPLPDMPFGAGSAKALAWAEDFAKELGLYVRNIDNYAVAMDWDNCEPELAVLSHLDVVPAGGGWTYEPFGCTVKDGVIYGRGAIDDKGPSVAVLYAVKCLKDMGVRLKKSFRLIMGGNEEGGCKDIEYYSTKEKFPSMVITPDGSFPILNCEKGLLHITFSAPFEDKEIFIINGVTALNAIPDKCEITRRDGYNVLYRGQSAHGSRPENGENAVTKFLADYKGGNTLLNGLARLFPHGEYDGSSCGLGFEDNISGKMTAALTMLNTKDGFLTCGIDIRFPIDRTLSQIKEIIISALGGIGFEVVSCDGMEPHYVPENSRLVQTLLKVYEKVTGKKGSCIAEGGVTYVHRTEGGVAFGAEFPEENNNMHGADEHISISTLKCNFMAYANAIVEICGIEEQD